MKKVWATSLRIFVGTIFTLFILTVATTGCGNADESLAKKDFLTKHGMGFVVEDLWNENRIGRAGINPKSQYILSYEQDGRNSRRLVAVAKYELIKITVASAPSVPTGFRAFGEIKAEFKKVAESPFAFGYKQATYYGHPGQLPETKTVVVQYSITPTGEIGWSNLEEGSRFTFPGKSIAYTKIWGGFWDFDNLNIAFWPEEGKIMPTVTNDYVEEPPGDNPKGFN